ncbi:MAG: hypothetical protein Q9212_007148 [Teloschistes hypoglaucus]
MTSFHYLRAALLSLFLAGLSHQVDIRIIRTFLIAGEAESYVAATCRDLPPGVCCKPPTSLPVVTTSVVFHSLKVSDIAAVWREGQIVVQGRVRRLTGCSGLLMASRRGPGRWLWRQSDMPLAESHAAEGASYITVPQDLPPSDDTAKWLASQGLLGLIWNGGKWFSTPETERLLGLPAISVQAKLRRDILSARKGNVYARSPPRMKYPTYMDINGSVWSDLGGAGFLYGDTLGNVRNLSAWFIDGILD